MLMHSLLRDAANSAGFYESDGTFLILSCGAEDTATILSSINSSENENLPPIDTIISILTLCTIPSPDRAIKALIEDILKPGGQLLFYEHVLSPRDDVAWWQRFWSPVWTRFFDGCMLDRPTHKWVDSLLSGEGPGSIWRERELSGQGGETDETLFWHQIGRFTKI